MDLSSPHRLRVLIVDDDDNLRESLGTMLELSGCEVVSSVPSAEAAIELAGTTAIEAVLMDVEMQGMGGIEGAREIRAVAPGAAIVVFSAFGAPALTEAAAEAGADDYVLKGVPLDELTAAVHAAVARRMALTA